MQFGILFAIAGLFMVLAQGVLLRFLVPFIGEKATILTSVAFDCVRILCDRFTAKGYLLLHCNGDRNVDDLCGCCYQINLLARISSHASTTFS